VAIEAIIASEAIEERIVIESGLVIYGEKLPQMRIDCRRDWNGLVV